MTHPAVIVQMFNVPYAPCCRPTHS